MIDHISLGVSDLDRSKRFYDAALAPLGIAACRDTPDGHRTAAVFHDRREGRP